MPKKELIIFDANFFIMTRAVQARGLLKNLKNAADELNLEYFISEVVFNEIKAPENYKNRFKQIINVEIVEISQIGDIKAILNDFNIRFPAQDPDLSRLVIAQDLVKKTIKFRCSL